MVVLGLKLFDEFIQLLDALLLLHLSLFDEGYLKLKLSDLMVQLRHCLGYRSHHTFLFLVLGKGSYFFRNIADGYKCLYLFSKVISFFIISFCNKSNNGHEEQS